MLTKSDINHVITHNLSTERLGVLVADAPDVRDNEPVQLIKQYDRPDFKVKPTKVDLERANRVELAYLKDQVSRLKDQIRRLHEEVNDEIKMLTAAMNDGKTETVEQVKRRISRLKGSLEYRGFVTD